MKKPERTKLLEQVNRILAAKVQNAVGHTPKQFTKTLSVLIEAVHKCLDPRDRKGGVA